MKKLAAKIGQRGAGTVLGRPKQQTMEEKEAVDKQASERAREQEEKRLRKEEEKRLREDRRKDNEAIVQGLVLGRVMWHYDVGPDLLLFIRNNDAVLGIFFCHEMHPYSRWKRAVVKISGMFANFGMACMFLDYESCKQKGLSKRLVTCEKEESDLVQAASVTCAILVSILLFCMYWFYTCRCARQGGPLHCGQASEKCVVCCTKPIVCSFAVFCLFIFCVGYWRHDATGIGFGDSYIPQVWALSEAYSFGMGICFQVCCFFSLYCGCGGCPLCACCNALCRDCWGSGQGTDNERPSFAYPHGDEYPKDMTLFWAGDRPFGEGISQNRLAEAASDHNSV